MSFSNYLANAILDAYFADEETWLSLHTSSPLASDLATGEITAPTYTRQRVYWSVAESRATHNIEGVTFTGLPLAEIPFLGVYTAQDGGDLLAELEADPIYKTNSNGSSIYLPAETIVVGLE